MSARTLRFTEWRCGHHGQRPEDIPVESPEQAKAICWAIACAISQPGHARAMLFNATHGLPEIYITDDHVSQGYGDSFNPEKHPLDRPVVVLCADEATATAILAPELKAAREDIADPDLWNARLWDGKDIPEAMVEAGDTVLTLLPRAEVEKRAEVDDSRLDPVAPLFYLPPVFHDGAQVLERLRTVAQELADWEARMAAEQEEPVTSAQPARVPGERWTSDRGAMPGEAFAWLDGDAETGRAAMFELAGNGTSRFEVRTAGGDVIAEGTDLADVARRAELELPRAGD